MAHFRKTARLLLMLALWSKFSYAQKNKHIKDDSLVNEFEKMVLANQKYRWMIMYGDLNEEKIEEFKRMETSIQMKRKRDVLRNNIGITQFQKDSLFALQHKIDSMNFIRTCDIIKATGIPGNIAVEKIALILQHAPIEMVDSEFFRLLMNEVNENRLPGIEYANLYDNVQLRRKMDELYYVIEHYDPSKGCSQPHIPKDIDRTNEERKKIGLKKFKIR